MTSADSTASRANQSETAAKTLPKSFGRGMFQSKRLISKFSSGSEKMTEDGQATTTTSAEKTPKGIRRIIRADSLKAKQSISRLFGSGPLKKEGVYLSAEILRSHSDDSASETSVEKTTSSANADPSNPVSYSNQLEGVDSERVWSALEAGPPHTQNIQVPISSPESWKQNDRLDSSMPTDTDFLTSVDATLSFGQVDYAASGMPEINFAAVIYGDEGFSIATPECNKASEPTAEKVPVPSAKTAHTSDNVQSRRRASSDGSSSSEDTAVRTRIFSFSQRENDSDESSVADPSDDESNYLSLKLPRTRIFRKKSKAYTTYRVRTSMPDLYAADPAEEQTKPEAAPVRLLTDSEDLPPDTKETGESDCKKKISRVEDLVSENPVSENNTNIADISPDNVMAKDGEENAVRLKRPSRPSPSLKTKLAIERIEILAEKCYHQLYRSEEWTATEELLHEIENLSTFTVSSQDDVSDFANNEDIADIVAANEDRFAEFTAAIEQCSTNGDEIASEEADTLINAVYGYQQVFYHLIKNIVAPGNERFHKLLESFFHLRSSEGELILEAERISHKLMQLHEENDTMGSAVRDKVSEVSSCLNRVEGRLHRCQSELARLENDFSKEIPTILVFISKTSLIREQVLFSWNSLHNVSELADLFDSFDAPNLIHKEEYEKMTSWHSTAAIGKISLLLSTGLAILVDCSSMLSTMFQQLRTERDMLILVSNSLPNLG